MTDRSIAWLQRNRWWILAIWLLHAFAMHYYVLGFMTWDGLGYRGTAVVELAQHGAVNAWKYTDWSYRGYVPFVELAEVPFVRAFGLPGLLVGFPLVVFPLCAAAVYGFARELTGDARSGLFGAIAYAALPMYNAGAFGGYVDFAICGLLALWAWSILRARRVATAWTFASIALATALFTMTRAHCVYIVGALLPVLGWHVRIANRRGLLVAIAGTLLGCAPAIAMQIAKYVAYGTPTYPLQFSLLGIHLGSGPGVVTLDEYYRHAGLATADAADMLRATVHGWIGVWQWPIGGFFDSRYMGAGLLAVLALALAPIAVRRATRVERSLLAACVIVSLLARDFVHPRWSYTIALAVIAVIARGLPALADAPRRRAALWIAFVVVGLHGLRPELDLLQLRTRGFVGPRLDVAKSPLFYTDALDSLPVFPDTRAKLAVIDANARGFSLPMYGKHARNEVIGTIRREQLGDRCAGLAAWPDALFVDDGDLTRDCARTCAWQLYATGICRAWRIDPPGH